jgi:hypothetical protein
LSPDGPWTVDHTAAAADRLATLTGEKTIDLVVSGVTDGTATSRHDTHRAHETAGATWWIESIEPWRFGWGEGQRWPLDQMSERIHAGP